MSFVQESTEPSLFENEVLDKFQIPFGSWIEQAVFWVNNELEWLLDIIKWPFSTLLDFLIDDWLNGSGWLASWWFIVLFMGVLGWALRGPRVGLFAVGALSICGILGPDYWRETAGTIGFIFVAVILCVVIGIPLGIACGRVDPVWNVVRPVLDAMQVVHSFVYMLPFIYWFGLQEVSATMVTMVFALPPLVRLTNLGIRQVPEDVVEASRAYGAPEVRVLADVQIPLARPAIATGLNQTLLLAISMLGIAAIMGAGGLGRLMFKAINNQDVAQGAGAGLAFFLVAVTLDRMSQPGEEAMPASQLFRRMRRAWVLRAEPEAMLSAIDADALAAEEAKASEAAEEETQSSGSPAPLGAKESLGVKIAGAGAVLGVISILLPWASDAGKISSHARFADETELVGDSFNGVSASGGTWFGIIVLLGSLFVLLAAIRRSTSTTAGRFFSADGIAMLGIPVLASAVAYVLASASPAAADYSDGFGAYLAIIAGLLIVGGAIHALQDAPYTPHRPLSEGIEWQKLVGAGAAVLFVIGGTIAGWSYDTRSDNALSDEDLAEVARLEAEAEETPSLAAANSVKIQSIFNRAQNAAERVNNAWTSDGPGFAPFLVLLALLGAATVPFGAGMFGADQHRRWRWSTITVGCGVAIATISMAWVISVARVVSGSFVSGVGCLLAILGGVFLVGTSRSLVTEFFREKIFDDDPATAPADETEASMAAT